jgi:hypothetical protein
MEHHRKTIEEAEKMESTTTWEGRTQAQVDALAHCSGRPSIAHDDSGEDE